MIVNNKKVNTNLFIIFTLTLLVISSFSMSTFARESESVVDDLGNKIELDEIPNEIISLSPNITELLFELGLGDKVIAVSEECKYPEKILEAKKNGEIKSVGFTTDLNLEKIVDLDADLVIADNINSKESIKRLNELGINVMALSPKDFESSFRAIEKIGLTTGYQNEAKNLITNMQIELTKVKKLLKTQDEKPSVFIEIWSEPIMTAGKGTFIDEVITLAGGKNIGAEAGKGWPQYSLEKILATDPEIYLISTHSTTGGGTPDLEERENFSTLTAIKKDRVFVIDQNRISRPGPRAVEGLIELLRYFHPELGEVLN